MEIKVYLEFNGYKLETTLMSKDVETHSAMWELSDNNKDMVKLRLREIMLRITDQLKLVDKNNG